jgi:hypothetical protein
MAKKEVFWAVKHWNGPRFYEWTVERTRRASIESFKRLYLRGSKSAKDKEWRDDAKYGVHRCVKVEIVEARP